MYISPYIDSIQMWLLVGSALCVLLLAAILFLRVRNVAKYRRRADSERPDKPDADYLPVSVIVYSQSESESLAELLPILLRQDYPAAYEVIVVNDGESVDVRDTVSMLRAAHPNLYLTFTPQGVVNLSRKKLALTLGIKAARYDVVALTTAAVEIESAQWLRRMMRPFGADSPVELVIGFAYVAPDEDDRHGRRRRAFDYVADSTRWLSVAIAGKPFRGTEYNIAYRKDLFMRNKGFASSLNLHYGDDDIFISQVARRANTVVELSDESIVRLREGNHPRLFTERTLRRFFTESFIRRRPRFLHGATGWLQIAAVACAAASAALAWPDVEPAIVGAVLIILMFALDIIVWRRQMEALKSRRLMLSIPWLSMTYPLRRIYGKIHARLGKQKKYTWD